MAPSRCLGGHALRTGVARHGRCSDDDQLRRETAFGHQSLLIQLSWLANHPEVLAAAHEALRTHGMGACGSPLLSGMTDLHRELERRVAKFLNREDAMLFNSGFGGALGTISGLLRKSDVALLDNRSHLSLRDGAVLSRCRTEKFEHNDPASLDVALSRQKGRRQLVVVEGIYS